jgi:putative Holliday junction resolvase
LPRILALDVGEKTIGVALSDESERIAFPGTTILRQEGKKRDMAALRQLVAENQVKEIVVGMPLMLDGTRGVQAEKIEAFVATLRNSVRIPIRTQDERLSTSEAERVLIAADRRREQRRQTVDSIAACLILQTYLDRKRNERPEREPDDQ